MVAVPRSHTKTLSFWAPFLTGHSLGWTGEGEKGCEKGEKRATTAEGRAGRVWAAGDVRGDSHAKVMAGRRGGHLTRRPNQSEAAGTPSPAHKKSIPADDT